MSTSAVRYDVALSFAGEDRLVVRQLAQMILDSHYLVFYDEYEKAELWGEDLTIKLKDVYGSLSRFCVMFISEHYAKKPWTKFERQAAISRMLTEDSPYVLPIRLDDTALPGFPETVGYLDLRIVTVVEVYELLRSKLGAPSPARQPTVPISRDRIRDVLAACYRRAIFARLHAQMDWEAMFDSLAQCRSSLQKMIVYVEPAELQRLVAGVIGEIDFIERRRTQFGRGDPEAIEAEIGGAKLRIISSLLKLKDAAQISFELPNSLTEEVFFRREEADSAPKGPLTTDPWMRVRRARGKIPGLN
jgi:hypothetical protein